MVKSSLKPERAVRKNELASDRHDAVLNTNNQVCILRDHWIAPLNLKFVILPIQFMTKYYNNEAIIVCEYAPEAIS